MVTYKVQCDELYPNYYFDDDGKEIELTKEEKEMIDKAFEEYKKAQDLLEERYKIKYPNFFDEHQKDEELDT
jgi:hypothetical protein